MRAIWVARAITSSGSAAPVTKRPSARSFATLLDDAIYGETLAPDRRGTLRNILLNSAGSPATAAGTDALWEVAGFSDRSQVGSLVEVSTLELPYRISGDAAPVVLALVVTGAAGSEAASRAAEEVADVAKYWGVAHAGRFSSVYAARHSEYPRATLRRS
ncbi:hypothetical protein [Curtobacterium sp. MCLR17_058]|uniref:hypothetical protein n=1 Tax=Curtobacterium sp. MCLR17_058 TaxID=2175635 RepID=UPI000DA9EADE|nr:hypothetical protein [Curtobacterium sp. MCLR17_058]WIB42683.1 hypothetical protein DEJ11_17895 [Curtobacterium sp. MCLR17_058]